MPVEGKKSMRSLANVRDNSALMDRPERLVHVGDRENYRYEFFCVARDAGTHFVARIYVNRLVSAFPESVEFVTEGHDINLPPLGRS